MKISFEKVLLLALTGILFLTACQPSSFPTVKSSFVSAYIPIAPDTHALTFDGNSITLKNFTQFDLKSGQVSYPFADHLPPEWKTKYDFMSLQWSADGHYLAAGASQIDPPEFSYNQPVYLLDTLSRSVEVLPDDVKPYYISWSPMGKRFLAYTTSASVFPLVYDLEKKSPVPTPLEATDNLEKQAVRGMGGYLWSKKLNIPVTQIFMGDPINAGGVRDKQSITINTVSIEKNATLNTNLSSPIKRFEFFPPDNVVSASFDPSGEYILVIQWKCSNQDPKQCTNYHEAPYFDSIVDTSLILLRWRTGEQEELIRLSQVDTEAVIANYAEWSADGSTILIWRKDASPIVLKIKYP